MHSFLTKTNKIMKKITALLVAGVSIFAATQLMSCSKKEDDKKTTKSHIGTWTSESAYGKSVVDGVTEFEITVPLANQIEYTFNSDNTFSAIDRTETPFETESGTYSISGNKIYSTSASGEKDTTEYELTADDKMKIFDNSTYTEDGKTHVETNNITFKRK